MNEPLLVVDLDRAGGEQSDPVLPGDHITACRPVEVRSTTAQVILTFIVDIARKGHVISNFDLEALLLGVECWRTLAVDPVLEVVLRLYVPCK